MAKKLRRLASATRFNRSLAHALRAGLVVIEALPLARESAADADWSRWRSELVLVATLSPTISMLNTL